MSELTEENPLPREGSFDPEAAAGASTLVQRRLSTRRRGLSGWVFMQDLQLSHEKG